ncbi:hypothetical protein [Anabaena azotica]|uniref:Uncharacterized protein n=1 Tax=Anabaena azotica FACHB-119 TaxID=947527 RepID=A0ABR8D593_9NOST|nr:hypothetical protein [Anabaena azotica]MBD2502338.1 hypothetical protein [Anabaena azotica FACHB-119]
MPINIMIWRCTAYNKNLVNLLTVNSEQLSVKYVGEKPQQLVEGVFWRLFISHHPPWLTDN